jgi:thymidylate synthase
MKKNMSKKYFEANTADELYKKAIEEVSKNPEYIVRPRGMEIKEILNVELVLKDPRNSLIRSEARKLNYAFAAMEKLQYLSGNSDSERLCFYNSNFANFKNDYNYYDGDYGTRIRYWLEHIIALLKKDPDSRQAVYTIFGVQDRHSSKDIPCTISHQFFLREGKLHMTAYMRSNDLLWGFPYDINGFVFIQEFLANVLGVELGTYTHKVGSLHLYTEREFDLLKVLSNSKLSDIRNPEIEKGIDFKDYLSDIELLLKIEKLYRKKNTLKASELSKHLPISLHKYLEVLKETIAKKLQKEEHI